MLSNYVKPDVKENKSKNWVMNGNKNEFYSYVIDRYNGSTTHAAIIDSYVDLIYGRGLRAKNEVTNVKDWVKLKQVLNKKDIRRIISDYVLFNEYSYEAIETRGRELASITHVPKQMIIPSIENEKGEIESYFYSKNWAKYTLADYKPEEFNAYNGKKQKNYIYVAKPYRAGCDYFSLPNYFPAMRFAEAEEEIANLYVNSIKNGLSAGYVINVANGKNWTPEEKQKFKKAIEKKLTGSPNASSFIISFNGEEVAVNVEALPVNENVHKQWAYLTEEARQQLITGHRVTSPMLFGIKDNTGLGNNADELDTAEEQLLKRVIRPKQDFILDGIQDTLRLYGINLDLYFQPLSDFDKEEPIALKKKTDLDSFLDLGEDYDESDEYDLINESEVNYEEEEKLTLALAKTKTGTARPNAKSSQDTDDIVIRYRYVGNKNPQREFCRKMISANKVYRKEDILQLKNKVVNPGWGPNGIDKYSIWLYKGGGNCKHKWNRVIYLKRGAKVDVNSPLAKTISTTEARRRGFKVEANDTLVSITPSNMVNKGFLIK